MRINFEKTNGAACVVEGGSEIVLAHVRQLAANGEIKGGIHVSEDRPSPLVNGPLHSTPMETPTMNWKTDPEPVTTALGGVLNPPPLTTPEYDFSGAQGAPYRNGGQGAAPAPLSVSGFNWNESSPEGDVQPGDQWLTGNGQGHAGGGVPGVLHSDFLGGHGDGTTTPLESPVMNWSEESAGDTGSGSTTAPLPELSLFG